MSIFDKHNKRRMRTAVFAAAVLALIVVSLMTFRDPFKADNVSASAGSSAVDPAEAKAENVSYRIALTSANGSGTGALLDTDRASKVVFDNADTLTARLKEGSALKLRGVYIIWDNIPGKWILGTGGTTVVCGQHGFIHEYVDFPSPADEIVFKIPAGAVMCDLIFYSEGVLPDSVQRWQPPYERADFLLFPTHGDDEHLFFGGIMPYYGGELGYKVQVAYMTNHAFTEMYRVHEQLNGLWTVGIRAYPCFGDFVDEYSKTFEAAAEMYGADNVERWQVEMIRRFKPYVVVGHDFEGEYGHGAHRINGTMLQKSVPDAADPSRYPESAERYGVWDTQKFYSHLYNRDNGVIIEWGNVFLSKFGGVSALEMAKKGYLCHDSQQWTSFRVMTDDYGDCRQFGLYRSTVGDDVAKNDLLEHVIFEPEPTEIPTEMPTDIHEPGSAAPSGDTVTVSPSSGDKASPENEYTPDGNLNTPETGATGKKDGSITWLIALLAICVVLLIGFIVIFSKKLKL